MEIWLVTIGEPIITKNQKLRLHRTGALAKYISDNSNHKVTWFTSTYNHFLKLHEYTSDNEYNYKKNLKIVSFKGMGYNKNISVSRIIDHYQVSKKFKNYIRKTEKPDIIISSFPTMNLCIDSINFGRRNKVKVLIDYRDLWPEVFLEIIPNFLKPFFKLILLPLYNKRKYILSNASGIITLTDELLKHCLKISNRKKNNFDSIFPLGYLRTSDSLINHQTKLFWDKILNKRFKKIICFFGTIGFQFDFETIIETASMLENTDYLFVICGDGDLKTSLEEKSKEIENIIFPGYMSAIQIKELLNRSQVGLCPYIPKKAFLDSIPGKAIEYFSNGLPILTTLGNGVLGNLVDEKSFGFNYEYQNADSLLQNLKEIFISIEEKKIDNDKILNYYNSKFDSQTVYNNYLNHIEKTVSNRK